MANFTKLATAAAVAALLSTPALADFHMEWDADADGALTVEEFKEGLTARLSLADWDADGDGLLSEEEFGGGVYDLYDLDATDAIEEAEYGTLEEDFGAEGIWVYEGEELVAAPEGEIADADVAEAEVAEEEPLEAEVLGLEAWDVDGDGIIVRDEFEDGFTDWGTFGEFDVDLDGFISEDELAGGVFGLYDEDGTGIIEEPELTDIGDDMGDEGFWDV